MPGCPPTAGALVKEGLEKKGMSPLEIKILCCWDWRSLIWSSIWEWKCTASCCIAAVCCGSWGQAFGPKGGGASIPGMGPERGGGWGTKESTWLDWLLFSINLSSTAVRDLPAKVCETALCLELSLWLLEYFFLDTSFDTTFKLEGSS